MRKDKKVKRLIDTPVGERERDFEVGRLAIREAEAMLEIARALLPLTKKERAAVIQAARLILETRDAG